MRGPIYVYTACMHVYTNAAVANRVKREWHHIACICDEYIFMN